MGDRKYLDIVEPIMQGIRHDLDDVISELLDKALLKATIEVNEALKGRSISDEDIDIMLEDDLILETYLEFDF